MMRAASSLVSIALIAVCLLWIGCDTTQDHRRRQYGQAFPELTEQEQRLSREGKVSPGMVPLAVYVAMGAPLKNGEAMYMPEVPSRGADRWYYRGKFVDSADDGGIEWIRFYSQFENVLSLAETPEYLMVEFENGIVSVIALIDNEDTVKRIWR